MKTLLDRFCRYVRIDTTAVENAGTYPSSPGQLELGRMLEEELRALGLRDAVQDEYGIVMVSAGSSSLKPTMRWWTGWSPTGKWGPAAAAGRLIAPGPAGRADDLGAGSRCRPGQCPARGGGGLVAQGVAHHRLTRPTSRILPLQSNEQRAGVIQPSSVPLVDVVRTSLIPTNLARTRRV
jgi:hypothetical protein